MVVACAAIATVAIFRNTQNVQAQEQPPPVNDRYSFGMVGLTAGQTMRINVSNIIAANDSNWPPGPTRVVLNFRLMNGQLARNRSGEVIRRIVELERGDSTFLDVDYDELPPSPIRVQLRAVVNVQPPPVTDRIPYDSAVTSVEVINSSNGKTLFMNPAVARGFNPQPDPPIE